jgi:Na+-translocating ferredoxin:NAD+ oxidoreductase subunit A
MDFGELFSILIGVIFINNFVLSKFLGLCPYIGVSKHMKPAIGMGFAVTFVMTLASLVSWLVYKYALVPFNIQYMKTITFILVIATLVQLVEMVIQKTSNSLYKALGIYLPLITTNCAVLGVALLNIDDFFYNGTSVKFSLTKTLVQGIGAGLGFCLAMIIMAGIRSKLEIINVPKAMKGIPIAFIIAGLMAIAFLGFSGLKI